MARPSSSRLPRLVAELRSQYGAPSAPPTSGAFELVLWEKVAYLADDMRRAEAFAELRRRVGLSPASIIAASPGTLRDIAARGGSIVPDQSARRMREAAEIVIGEFDNALDAVLTRPFRDAKRALQRFHGIGEPGAERILLLTRSHQCFPLDSNGVRTLQRIGYGAEHKSYSATYKSVVSAVRDELVADYDWLIEAHLLLRRHGQLTCKTTRPRCDACCVRTQCAFGGGRISAARSLAKSSKSARRPSSQ